MTPADLTVLTAVAFATAVLSAVVGLAGGMVLLTVMVLYLEPLAAIPLHGAVQLLSNGSRTWLQRRHVHWPVVLPYALPLLPLGWAGLALARELPEEALRVVIGGFVLLATWAPALLWRAAADGAASAGRRFFVLGAVAGFLGPVVGATGPLVAPFYLPLGLPRQGVIGSQAACQTLGHLAKIVLFGLAGFAFAPYAVTLAALALAVVAGTWVGSHLLERTSEPVFRWLYRGVLTVLALRLLLPGLARLF